MQWRKRWNNDRLLGRNATKSAGQLLLSVGISIPLQATEMGRQAAAPPSKDAGNCFLGRPAQCREMRAEFYGRIQRPSVPLFSSPVVSLIWSVESTVIVKSQSGSKQAAGMGIGASIVRWPDSRGGVEISITPPGENLTRVIEARAFPWP